MEKHIIFGFICCATSGLIAGSICESWFCILAVIIAIIGGALIACR